VIRIDSVWLAVAPLDMRAGTEAALARVVGVFGAARPHHACPICRAALAACSQCSEIQSGQGVGSDNHAEMF